MHLSRYLTENLIKLEMSTEIEPFVDGCSLDKWRLKAKESVLGELVDLLDQGNRIGNRTKLLLDFINREKKATTGIGKGVAIPHIRSLQAKEFMVAFARSTHGYDFDSLDQQPTHLFFVMASPPYDDGMYLKAFKAIAEMFQYDAFREELMKVSAPGEVIRALRSME
ncbi:MAG: PTS sugar transporter subunit IIA [Candidatus Zixiibacteriota bacterium]